jgi:hypothetical protein
MTSLRDGESAAVLVELLLGHPAGRRARGADWNELSEIARDNGVLLRVNDRLAALGFKRSPAFLAAVDIERRRARAVFDLVRRVGEACEVAGIPHLFAKAARHYPDVGRDVDVLVAAAPAAVDRALRDGVSALPTPRGLSSRLSRTTTYIVPGCAAPLDVQHGCLGAAGEHDWYASDLLRGRRPTTVGGIDIFAPSPEDSLVLQGLQRVYGRVSIRISDVVSTVPLLRSEALDWGYIVRTATRLGVLPGLRCYLTYANQICGETPDASLFPRDLVGGRWGVLSCHRDGYRFPAIAVNARVYMSAFATKVQSREWASAVRICALPAVAVTTAVRRAARKRRRSAIAGSRAASPRLGLVR